MFKELFDGFNNLLFPIENVCLFCGMKSDEIEDYLCPYCREKIEFVNRDLRINSPYLDRVVCSLFYNNFIKEKLYSYKYYEKGYLHKPLGEILFKTFKEKFEDENIELITYVPIHKRKKAQRGYNQSELVADYLSQKLGIPLSRENLIKTKWTPVQNTLNRSQRRENLYDSFKIKDKEEFVGKKTLIIDDIITTGTTMEECARVVLEAGAKKVHALSITSGMKM
jgi:ComF family protein